ncbi:hypothetical protein [Candidatus Venteria ishoeyi]|uniref:Uncharacterized protein n=1 Tax=Candidatus Venteria ishoeyi TaxID=1899563 RepID=A0A1H6F656_9GAMM|nr:hypothetical protein [Candidatus Venteria ishoeyi]SEH04759.1 Uncharacterised protein [Candidatus Venteria ishoeyi]
MFYKYSWFYFVLLFSSSIVNAAGFGLGSLGGGSGAHIGGDSHIDVKVGTAAAVGLKTESRIMIGHVADGVSTGGDLKMRIRTGNVFALGFRFMGIEKKACIAIGVIGGHCF